MSERDANGYEIEKRRKARELIVQAVGEYADSHEITEGALCTGYVTVMELTTAEGRCCLWLTGSGGTPDAGHIEGLDSWRVEGLVRNVLRDLDRQNTSDE